MTRLSLIWFPFTSATKASLCGASSLAVTFPEPKAAATIISMRKYVGNEEKVWTTLSSSSTASTLAPVAMTRWIDSTAESNCSASSKVTFPIMVAISSADLSLPSSLADPSELLDFSFSFFFFLDFFSFFSPSSLVGLSSSFSSSSDFFFFFFFLSLSLSFLLLESLLFLCWFKMKVVSLWAISTISLEPHAWHLWKMAPFLIL
mmetsp:Transcript_22062/g.32025  ORF Transcript_22062/g.32025 Transcript_22062/m.32025 type:complete len:204 (+) Transcript_22062:462-1073(+)